MWQLHFRIWFRKTWCWTQKKDISVTTNSSMMINILLEGSVYSDWEKAHRRSTSNGRIQAQKKLSSKLSRTKASRSLSMEQLQGSFFYESTANLFVIFSFSQLKAVRVKIREQIMAAKHRWQRYMAVDCVCDQPPNFEPLLRHHFKSDFEKQNKIV